MDDFTDIQPEQDPREFLVAAMESQNLVDGIDDAKLGELSHSVLADYQLDKESMSDWFEKMERGIGLATLVKEDRNYPFKGAANIKYPLVTSAALHFNARAYPALVPADRAVNARVWGDDPQGAKAARGERIAEFMSYQLTGPIEEWEEETDNLVVQLPIVGTMVRKWWYDPVSKRPRCRNIDPGKFIVNNKVKSLPDAPRATEELPLYPVEIQERINIGDFVSFEWTDGEDEQGPQEFIEQHTRIDLDDDGYPEPYVVTMHVETQKIVRVVADYSETDVSLATEVREIPQMTQDPLTGGMMMQAVPTEVVTGVTSIRRGSYFVAHKFMPSMDGGFHGTGLGILLGDISDTINSIINMMLDAGHYASLGGGFIGSEFRMKGGAQRHRPGEWKMVQSSGQDIRQAIVPMTLPGPDQTLFTMLGMLIDAGREIAGVKDVMTGEQPRQQQTATTTLALIEQGMMVFTAAYKRLFRSMKKEYTLLARINAETLDPQTYSQFHDMMSEQGQPQQLDPAQDFSTADMDVQPVADPGSITKMQQAAKAQFIMQLAEMGLVDKAEAMARIAEAMSIEDVEDLIPQPDPMAQEMQMMQMQAAKAELAEKAAKIELIMAQVDETRSQTIENIASAQNDAARVKLETKKARMDGLFKSLEEDRARLETVLRGFGGMEGRTGNGNAAQGAANPNGPSQGGNAGIMVPGQPGAGRGPAGPYQSGSVGGGFL